jgi:hypothetical protein
MLRAWLKASDLPAQFVQSADDTAQVFIAGSSIRGFSVHRRWVWFRNRVEVRLSIGASLADWRAAYSLLGFALQQGFDVRSEDGSSIGADALTDEAALQKGHEQFTLDVGFLRHLTASSGKEGVDLPNSRFAVPVNASDLPSEPISEEGLLSLQSVLQRRAAKYAAARSASVITLKTGATAIVWSGEPLLAPVVDHVVLAQDELDPAKYVYVAWDRALHELSDGVERNRRTPPLYYFAAMAENEPRWRRLLEAGTPLEQLGRPAG